MRIFLSRHVGYTAGGVPIFSWKPPLFCGDNPPNPRYGRQVGYGAETGLPLFATPWACCDAYCPDDFSTNPCYAGKEDCYVQTGCWPGGITRQVFVYLANVKNCDTADGVRAGLCYDDGLGYWTGSVGLRGGTLNLRFKCNPGDPGDPGKFTLEYDKCEGGAFSALTAGYSCSDPLVINFGQAVLPTCCDCPIVPGGPPPRPITDENPEVAFYLVANCHNVGRGRHVGYVEVGPNTGTPIFARERPCDWDKNPPLPCSVTCGLVATVSEDPDHPGECGCLYGTYNLDFAVGGWHYAGGFACLGSPGEINFSCSDNHDGTMALCVDIVCSATCGGSACITVPANDLDTVDETIEVRITCPASSCTPTGCSWTWNAMSGVWELGRDDCADACGPCGNAPSNPPADPVDGQVWTEECPGNPASECCLGYVLVRVMR